MPATTATKAVKTFEARSRATLDCVMLADGARSGCSASDHQVEPQLGSPAAGAAPASHEPLAAFA